MSYSSTSSDELEQEAYSERTLAIIKPEAYEHAQSIIDTILVHGFSILAKRTVRLSPEQAAELYAPHYGRCYFPHLVAHMSSGEVVALVLAAHDAVFTWKRLMGPARVAEALAYWPESVRACYGRRTKYGDYFNAVHGSDTPHDAQIEIHFFFPDMVVGPVLRKWQVTDYMQANINSTLLKALTELVKRKPVEPILFLAEYLQTQNPNGPQISSPPTTHDAHHERCHTPPPSEVTGAV